MALRACFNSAALKLATTAYFKARLEIGSGGKFRGGAKRPQLSSIDLTADCWIRSFAMSAGSIDLHTHTTYSDGSDTPEELVIKAANGGAAAIAITDHDTVAGLSEGRAAAMRLGIEFVDGVEISAEYSPGTMHILGYFVDPDLIAPGLLELKEARKKRNPQIADRLRKLGMDVSYDEVAALAGGEMVGRPHFARLLVEKRYAESIQDAFNRFLAKGAPAYVEKRRLTPPDAINLIHNSGGVAVLAHPYQLMLGSFEEARSLTAELAQAGLDGLEAIYSRHTQEQRERYQEIARGCGLLITGGSDYHGTYKPDLSVLTGKGDLAVPYSLLYEIRERARSFEQRS